MSRRAKFFFWLAALDRCWTADRLERHGLPHKASCVLCDQCPETIQHILVDCPFARQVWYEMLAWIRATCQPPTRGIKLVDWWPVAKRATPKPMRKGLASMTLLTAWQIWKQRNTCTFDDDARPSCSNTLVTIKSEANLWARAGALGLRVLLPNTWDVH